MIYISEVYNHEGLVGVYLKGTQPPGWDKYTPLPDGTYHRTTGLVDVFVTVAEAGEEAGRVYDEAMTRLYGGG